MHAVIKYYFLIIVMGAVHLTWAQETSGHILPDGEYDYLIDYSDQLSLKVFGISKSNWIRHFDNLTQQFVEYRPNENFNIGLGIGHKWLNLDLAFNFASSNKDNDIFGETKRFDIQANMYLKNFIIDLNYQTYKGYYVYNPQDYLDTFDPVNPVYPIRPDIRTRNTATNVLYNFKPDQFSHRAAFVYNQRQLRSSGSWLLGASMSLFRMTADDPIIPEELMTSFNTQADFRGVNYINLSIGGGYGHTFIISKKYFISLTLVLGFGPTFKSFPNDRTGATGTEVEGAVRAIGRTAFGFNGKRTFWGISSITSSSSEIDDTQSYLSRSIFNVKVFFGIRLQPPGISRD